MNKTSIMKIKNITKIKNTEMCNTKGKFNIIKHMNYT